MEDDITEHVNMPWESEGSPGGWSLVKLVEMGSNLRLVQAAQSLSDGNGMACETKARKWRATNTQQHDDMTYGNGGVRSLRLARETCFFYFLSGLAGSALLVSHGQPELEPALLIIND